jgi:hypothetical protein
MPSHAQNETDNLLASNFTPFDKVGEGEDSYVEQPAVVSPYQTRADRSVKPKAIFSPT